MRLGMELEFWVTDRSGSLVPAEPLYSCEGVEAECIESLVEIKTPPCSSLEDLQRSVLRRLERAVRVADRHDRLLVPISTPMSAAPIEYRDTTRTRIQQAVLGSEFRYAACAGVHLHLEQVDPLCQANVLTAIDPAFALTASSPYFDGDRVAGCARPLVYRRWCYRRFPGHGRLWRYVNSRDEWDERIDERFAAFRAAARRSGIDPATFDDAFSPETAVWSPVRIRDDLSTVEWRGPDIGNLESIFRLVARVIDLVRHGVHHGIRIGDGPDHQHPLVLPPMARVRRVVDAAIAEGKTEPTVRSYLHDLGFEPTAYPPTMDTFDRGPSIDPPSAKRIRRRIARQFVNDLQALRTRVPIEADAKVSAPLRQ